MTKKQLIEVIRKVVRQEVKKQVDEIFIQESVKQVAQPKKVSKSNKTYVKDNQVLNDILNETVALSKGKSEEYPTMGGKPYTTQNMADVLGYGDFAPKEKKIEASAAQTLAEKGVTPEQVGEPLVNALTRDYSELVKRFDKK